MTRRIPDVPNVPDVQPISEAWPMEECILELMSSFWELIYSIWSRISSVFKRKSTESDSTWWETLEIWETKHETFGTDTVFDQKKELDSSLLGTREITKEDICLILERWGDLDYKNPEISRLIKRIIWDAWYNEDDFKLLIDNLYKIDGVDPDFIDTLTRGIDSLFDKLQSWKFDVVNKSGGSTFDYQLALDIQYLALLKRFKKYRSEVLTYVKNFK